VLPALLIAAGFSSLALAAATPKKRAAGGSISTQPSGRCAPGDPRAPSGRCISLKAAARWAPLVDKYRGATPRWLMFGHEALEADGNPKSNTDNVMCSGKPCRERGLMQLMPAQSAKLGYDHDRQYEPDQSLAAGAKMYKAYKFWLDQRAKFATADDLWRVAYLMFQVGESRVQPLLIGLPIVTWALVADRVAQTKWNKSVLRGFTLPNNDTVFAVGHQLDRLTARVA
jgi:hypothetical protein